MHIRAAATALTFIGLFAQGNFPGPVRRLEGTVQFRANELRAAGCSPGNGASYLQERRVARFGRPAEIKSSPDGRSSLTRKHPRPVGRPLGWSVHENPTHPRRPDRP